MVACRHVSTNHKCSIASDTKTTAHAHIRLAAFIIIIPLKLLLNQQEVLKEF